MSAVVHSISENPQLRIARLIQMLVTQQRLAALDELRTHLPLDDPDRHALDTVDAAYARITISFPDPDALAADRRAVLLRAVKAQGGRWKSGRAIRLYESLGYGRVGRHRTARDLLYLASLGHLIRHETDGVRYFTRPGDDRA